MSGTNRGPPNIGALDRLKLVCSLGLLPSVSPTTWGTSIVTLSAWALSLSWRCQRKRTRLLSHYHSVLSFPLLLPGSKKLCASTAPPISPSSTLLKPFNLQRVERGRRLGDTIRRPCGVCPDLGLWFGFMPPPE